MSNALIGALRIVLGLDSAAFEQGLSLAEKKLNRFGKQMGKIGDNLTSVGGKLSTFVTAPIAAFGALTLKTAGDFEASMNRVGAATGATGAEFEKLRQLAVDLGQNTSKSASESADMLEMLAKNGLNAGQILDGAAESAIKLSEATGGDLARSADVATNVMAQFGLKAQDLATVVDQITGVTLQSQFGFDDYALALGQAGGVAGSLGVSLTDFNAALAATSDVFNSGSDAGTSFKTFLTRLVPQSQAAMGAMQKLGLEFFDANGKMKSMAEIAEELKTGLAGLSDEAKNDALQTIFGQDAMRTAVALGNEGAAGINAMTEAINKKGLAEEQAAARMKGFNGEMEKLGGAFESLQIAIASSGLLAMVTELVAKLAEWMTALAQSDPEMLKWGAIVAGLAAAIGPVLLGLGMMASGISVLIGALGLLVAPIGLVVAAFAGIAAAWVYWDEIKAAFPGFAAVVETTLAALGVALNGAFENMKLMITGIVQLMRGDWAGVWETAKQIVLNFGQTLLSIAEKFMPETIAALRAKAGELVEVFAALPGKMMEIGAQIIDGLWQGLKGKFAAVKDGLSNFANDLVGSVRSTLGIQSPSKVMHEIGQNIMAGLGLGMSSGMDGVNGVAAEAAGGITGTFKGLEASAAATGGKIKDAWAGMREVTAEAKDAGSAMDGIFSDVGSSIAGLIKGTKTWRDVLADVLGKISQMALSNLGSMGGFGGFLSSLLGGLTGFASGGTIMPGGTGGIDSQVVAFRKSPNERVDITKPGQRIGGSPQEVVIRGVFVDDNGVIKARIDTMGQQASQAGAAAGVGRVKQSLPGWQMQLKRDGRLA